MAAKNALELLSTLTNRIMQLTTYRVELKWAFVFIGMTLLWLVLEMILGFHDQYIEYHPIVSNLIAVPAILIYVFALLDKRKSFYEGKLTYKQGLVTGIIISLIITLFVPITQSIISLVITPDYFDNAIKYSIESGNATREEATSYFNLKSYIIQGVIFTPVIGIITTLIVAIFVKRS
ncbi:MAG: DUF4199 domain-containing protein [Bacteroidota bacterium]